MSKEMIISVNGREKKIAIVENGQTTEFYIERGEENSGVVGNIYKGRVQRVLPGMQSAFVDIGLERDAFLYVSDFFDEEEEIERIVLEKKKKEKKSDDEADREATDEIHKKRLKRDKKIDNVQEKAESSTGTEDESDDSEDGQRDSRKQPRKKSNRRGRGKSKDSDEKQEEETKKGDSRDSDSDDGQEKKGRGRRPSGGRGKSDERGRGRAKETSKKDDPKPEPAPKEKKSSKKSMREDFLDPSDIEFSDSSFERIIDEEDTGEMLKDAIMQEAITDKVRAIEFDMESVDTADVGSFFDSVEDSGFQRVADEEEEEETPKKSAGRGRSRKPTKSAKDKKEASDKDGAEKPKRRSRKKAAPKSAAGEKDSRGSDDKSDADSKKKPKSTPRKRTASRKKNANDAAAEDNKDLEGKDASVSSPPEVSEMAVRRGSRGGRRRDTSSPGKKPETTTTHMDKGYKASDADSPVVVEEQIANAEFKKKPAPRGRGRGRGNKHQPKITDLLKEGQEILVQIAKEPIARKGARITSHIALPGRFLVYMPTIEHLGVSRKIESSKERSRLRNLLQNVVTKEEVPSGGFIVRTAGIGKSEDEIREDARYLAKTWVDIKKGADKAKSKSVIHQDLDIILRLLRDQLSDDFSAIRVDSEDEFQRIVEFVHRIQPKLVKRVKFHTLDEPILDTYGVSEEIDKALKHRVWLKSGGYLVLNQTEALIAIDVNTGKFVGKGNARLEDTITKTNMEAVKEIARQIRLRDLGGIIVLDLIDMEDRNNRKRVLQSLQEQLTYDKSPTKVLSFNDFGLIIMTRKRVKQSLERTLCSPCENCEGAGWIKSAQTVCYEILEESRRLSKGLVDVRQTTLRVHPEVAKSLQGEEREVFDMIENYLGVVDINGDKTVHQEQYDFAFI